MGIALTFLTKSSGKGNKANLIRLSLISLASAIGVSLLLIIVLGINDLVSISSKESFWNQFYAQQKPIEGISPLKVSIAFGNNTSLYAYKDEPIDMLSFRATDSNSPTIKNLKTPSSGEYYLSPRLHQLVQEHPEYNLTSRFGHRYLGEIPKNLTSSPDRLMAINHFDGKSSIDIYTIKPVDSFSADSNMKIVSILFSASILLTPVIVLIGIATRLGSAQREKRYAGLRLIGATRGQINKIIATESLMATITGILIGSLIYLASIPILSNFQLSGQKFWIDSLVIPLDQYVLIIITTILFCLFANWWGMRRVQFSPLGVMRQSKPEKKPWIWRIILLALCISYFMFIGTKSGREWFINGSRKLYLVGPILLIMLGLVLAGAYITRNI